MVRLVTVNINAKGDAALTSLQGLVIVYWSLLAMLEPLKDHCTLGHGSDCTDTGTVTMVPKSPIKRVPTRLSLTAPMTVSSKARAMGETV